MLVSNQKMKEVENMMNKLDNDMRSRKVTDFRIARLRNELRMMAKDRESVERSKNEQRISKFNKLFISKIAELSKLMQTTGFSSRDDAAELVRQIKAQ